MLKIGVLGAGHLGKIHISCISEIKNFELVGFYDPDNNIAGQVEKDFKVKKFDSISSLIDSVDIVDIVTPTVSHYKCATEAIKKLKHVFIEKPLVSTLAEAKKLIDLTNEANVKVQVGHVERFNPAFLAVREFISNPMFIEAHRLAEFKPRGTDVPVILDLMIHDIDVILSVVKSDIKKISASGVAVVSDSPDIANARIEFNNGCVANLTASRISMKTLRKSRFFQNNAYISVDYNKRKAEIIKIKDVEDINQAGPFDIILDMGKDKKPKQILIDNPSVLPINSIKTELESFYESIENNVQPAVSIMEGYMALEVAYKIINKINSH
jgi:predicted dehydrogenase